MDQVGQAWGQAAPYLDWIYALLRSGFYEVNDVRGILIAAIGAYVMTNYRRVPVIVLGCVAADLAVRILGPVVVNKSAIQLPAIVELGFWQSVLALILGYFVVVTVLYVVKTLLLRLFDGGGRHAHGH
jgi:hypothetical protein